MGRIATDTNCLFALEKGDRVIRHLYIYRAIYRDMAYIFIVQLRKGDRFSEQIKRYNPYTEPVSAIAL
jgi:hypothetical protein